MLSIAGKWKRANPEVSPMSPGIHGVLSLLIEISFNFGETECTYTLMCYETVRPIGNVKFY